MCVATSVITKGRMHTHSIYLKNQKRGGGLVALVEKEEDGGSGSGRRRIGGKGSQVVV